MRTAKTLISLWADAQDDLILRWAHSQFFWFCHEVSHIIFLYFVVAGVTGLHSRNVLSHVVVEHRHVNETVTIRVRIMVESIVLELPTRLADAMQTSVQVITFI